MGPININEIFTFRNNEYDLEALTSYINLLITVDLCIAHIFTSPRDYGTILHDCGRIS